MATEKQINANRENAKKSTGPRTPEGKSVSSRNALKTGKFAKTLAARMAAEYKTLIADFTSEFNPATPEEHFYLRALVHAAWQGRLYGRLEADIWEMHRIEDGSKAENSIDQVFFRAAKDLDRIGRLMESAHNSFHWALKQLLDIREDKQRASTPRRAA